MKTKIKIPENLSEITLVQYQHFIKECRELQGDLLRQRTVEHFCAIPLSQVLLISLKDVREISDHIDNIFSVEKELKPTFKVAGIEFGLIPDFENIAWGEYIDLDSYINEWDNMHKAVAVMYRPVTTKIKGQYLIEDYESSDKYSELMKLAPLDVVLGAMVFFYALENELLKISLQYLNRQVKEEILANSHSLENNGGGTVQSIEYLEEILEDMKKSQSTNFLPFLHSSPLKLKKTE
jgi:hypothetical protein